MHPVTMNFQFEAEYVSETVKVVGILGPMRMGRRGFLIVAAH